MSESAPVDLNNISKKFFIAGIISLLLVIVGYFTGTISVLGWFLYIGAAMILVGIYLKIAAKRK
jgi:hypothetical protein